MSKPGSLALASVKIFLIGLLLAYCAAWPDHENFGSIENVCVLTIIIGTGIAIIVEAAIIYKVDHQKASRSVWFYIIHALTLVLTIIEAICVFLYSQVTSRNYRRFISTMKWTNASEGTLLATADVSMKAISIVIVVLSLITSYALHERHRKRHDADLDEVCTAAYLENEHEPNAAASGMNGSPYL